MQKLNTQNANHSFSIRVIYGQVVVVRYDGLPSVNNGDNNLAARIIFVSGTGALLRNRIVMFFLAILKLERTEMDCVSYKLPCLCTVPLRAINIINFVKS